jgi:uncharacterized protein (TIGR03083 family)
MTTKMTTKAEILAALEREHQALEELLAGLTPEQLTTPIRDDGWTIKDILAHIAAWESEMVTALFHATRGTGGAPSLGKAIENMDAWNAQRHAENTGRSLDRILADWRGVREALVQRLESWDDKTINQSVRWPPARTFAELIEANSYGHEAEHREEIARWRAAPAGPGGAPHGGA